MLIRHILGCAILINKTSATSFGTTQEHRDSASVRHQAANDDVTKWGVIASAGQDYHDYHLQADVCHAYHILHHHGVPGDNVVVMVYDDVAYNPRNPTPGIVANYLNGRHHYAGAIKDYFGASVAAN